MTNSILYIRADGNAKIGTGHIMRCLSIAKRLSKEANATSILITADHEMEELFCAHGIRSMCLDSQWNQLDCETEKMIELIQTHNIQKLLIDSYYVTESYLKALCEHTYVIYMDDLDAFIYPCHALVNYNFYAQKHNYPERYPHSKLYLGPQYAPLREEFRNLPPKEILPEIHSVMVTTGGSDSLGSTEKIIRALKSDPKTTHILTHVVIGRFAKVAPMNELSKEYAGIVVHQNIVSMSGLMRSCDVAIAATGSTLYELCACGTPTIAFTIADNQLEAANAFQKLGGLYAGDMRAGIDQTLCAILSLLKSFSADQRRNLSIIMKNMMCEGKVSIKDIILRNDLPDKNRQSGSSSI